MSNFDLGLGDGFLGQLLDPDMLVEAGVATGGAVLGSLAYTALVDMVRVELSDKDLEEGVVSKGEGSKRPLLDTPLKRMAGALGLGLVGGLAAWRVSPDLAKGHVGAMMGAAGGELYNVVTGRATVRLPAANEAEALSIRNLQVRLPGQQEQTQGLAGAFGRLGDASVLMPGAGGALADAGVESVDDFDVPGDDIDLGAMSSIVASG